MASQDDAFLLLEGLSKYDRKRDHKIPIAALQLAVEDLVDRVPAELLKTLIDQFCKRVQDGFIDFSALHREFASASPRRAAAGEVDMVRQTYEQWYLGKWGRDKFINELAKLPEVHAFGGVPPRVVQLVEQHQFTHGLSYAQFLSALRGNASAGTGETKPEAKSRGKKHFEGQVYRQPPPYVHPENGVTEAAMRGAGYHKGQTSEAVSTLLSHAGGPEPPRGVARVPQSSTATLLYHGQELDEDNVRHNRRHFRDTDKVGELFAGAQCELAPHEDADSPTRGRRHFESGAGTYEASDWVKGDQEAASQSRRTPHQHVATNRDNGHIAIGQHVSDFIPKTTQELLWGNMIRRAR